MDEQTFLHQVSADTDVNIELLKDLYHDEKLCSLIKANNVVGAVILVRSIQPKLGLREAKQIVDAFKVEM